MPLHPLLLEPEIHSLIFLSVNVVGWLGTSLILRSWPLSLLWTCLYFLVGFFVNNGLAAGRYYLPLKKLHNETVVITAGASGMGRVCALRLAKLGARIIIGVRGQERAERIAKELSNESNGETVIGYDLDLSSLASVKAFAEKIDHVDILINNARVTESNFVLTVDGIEKQFAINHIGHFYLTQLLLPLLKNGRIINVSSIAHHLVSPTDIDYSFTSLKQNYVGRKAYGLSKIAQIYHASELTRRCGVKAYSLHPGVVMDTNLSQGKPLLNRIGFRLLSSIGKTVEQGSMTYLYSALSNDAKAGCFHSDCQVRQPS